MKAYAKQIKILAAIGLVLIAVVFIVAAFTPLTEQRRFATQQGVTTRQVTGSKVSIYPVNINTATAAELQTLPEIGEKTAQKIIAYREAHGTFKTKEELLRVNGIGEKTYEQIKDLICL